MSGSPITTAVQLREAVTLLKARQAGEGQTLREHFMMTYDTMRPVNLIKSAFNEVTESQELKDHLVSTGVGLVAGHTSKMVFESVSDSPVKGLIGTAIQFGVTNAVARHPDLVIAAGRGIFRLLRSAWRNRRQTEDELTDDDEPVHEQRTVLQDED